MPRREPELADPAARFLALQRTAGNRAVTNFVSQRVLARNGGEFDPVAKVPGAKCVAAGANRWTFVWGQTKSLREAVREAEGRTEISEDPKTGLRTITATYDGKPTQTFVERASYWPASDEITLTEAQQQRVDGLADKFKVANTRARDELTRLYQMLISEHSRNDFDAVHKDVFRMVNALSKSTTTTVEQALLDRRAAGATLWKPPGAKESKQKKAGKSAEELKPIAEQLVKDGLLEAPEWLAARDPTTFVGALGEFLAVKQAVGGAKKGQVVLRNVHFTGDLFEDQGCSETAKDEGGRKLVKTDCVPELDLLVGTFKGEVFVCDEISNVKAVQPSDAAGKATEAMDQDLAAREALSRPIGTPIERKRKGKPTLWAKVATITALRVGGHEEHAQDGEEIDLTGKVEVPSSVALTTVGPTDKSKEWTKTLAYGYNELNTLVELVRDIELRRHDLAAQQTDILTALAALDEKLSALQVQSSAQGGAQPLVKKD